ncbi:putative AP2-endonuclease [Acaryochloris phage A-HIS1]|nr:putative AP2-endonuclease [Acaryochloris phage A-HIS1]
MPLLTAFYLPQRTKIMNKRPIFLEKGYAYTRTSKGNKLLVSYEDLDLIESFSWSTATNGYAVSRIDKKVKYAHKIIQRRIGFDGICDHINRDRMDCRRENLRHSNHTKNNHNVSMQKNNASGYLGVCFCKHIGKYKARITVNSKSIHLGVSTDPLECARMYDEAASRYHGPHSTTNKSLGNY